MVMQEDTYSKSAISLMLLQPEDRHWLRLLTLVALRCVTCWDLLGSGVASRGEQFVTGQLRIQKVVPALAHEANIVN